VFDEDYDGMFVVGMFYRCPGIGRHDATPNHVGVKKVERAFQMLSSFGKRVRNRSQVRNCAVTLAVVEIGVELVGVGRGLKPSRTRFAGSSPTTPMWRRMIIGQAR
jgi:hypothetical protein